MIGDRLAMAERGAFVMVVSDHGFGRYEKNFYLNTVLEQHGLLHAAGRSAKQVATQRLSTRPVIDAIRRLDVIGLEGRVPHRFRERLARGIDSALSVPIDLERTLAYAAAASAESVFIAAAGARTTERDDVARRVIEALEAARDPDTGEPIIERALPPRGRLRRQRAAPHPRHPDRLRRAPLRGLRPAGGQLASSSG